MNKDIACIILAAGRGERMKSDLPKVLHSICGRAILDFVLDLVRGLKIKKRILVLGYKHRLVKQRVDKGTRIVIQRRLQGSADAVKQTRNSLKGFKGMALVLYADHPLLKRETLKRLIEQHKDSNADATLLTAKVKNPTGYGRILRDKYASICRIIEEKDADAYQKDIKEINIGASCFNTQTLFNALRCVKRNKRKNEYYLTDVIDILYRQGGRVEGVRLSDLNEAQGINSGIDLAKANRIMQTRIIEGHMKNGVTVLSPGATFIDWGVKIGRDTRIYPFTVIERGVKIGRHASIGPFCHLREGVIIEDNSRIGNFTELVRSKMGKFSLAKHFCYIGDAIIGRNVNVGAGMVTANFDGKKKNVTIIKDNAFLGCDTVLVAPVKIGASAVTGAGAVVTRNKDVADNTVVVGVPAQPLKRGVKRRWIN